VEPRFKLTRLWQPGRLLFWMMLAFNVLSSLCSYAMRTLPLNRLGLLLVASVALLNVAGGLWAAWQLVKAPGPGLQDRSIVTKLATKLPPKLPTPRTRPPYR
jgi:hypothetical protein